jgi:hypothetical protein
MANPSGGTFHYSHEDLNKPGYPGIVRDDGSRAEPASYFDTESGGQISGLLRDHPTAAFFGAVAVGFLASCLLSRC